MDEKKRGITYHPNKILLHFVPAFILMVFFIIGPLSYAAINQMSVSSYDSLETIHDDYSTYKTDNTTMCDDMLQKRTNQFMPEYVDFILLFIEFTICCIKNSDLL